MIFPVSKTVLSFTPKSSIRAIFRPKNYFVCFSKTMHWDTFVFSCFSLIFGCSLTVFSVHLDASPWNLEFFWFTRTSFFVHQKNSRFQGTPVASKKTLDHLCEPEKVPVETSLNHQMSSEKGANIKTISSFSQKNTNVSQKMTSSEQADYNFTKKWREYTLGD